MTLADVVHRIATDENFAAQLRVEPQATLKASGLNLPAETLAALLKVLRQAMDSAYAPIIPPCEQPLYTSRFLPRFIVSPSENPWYNSQFSNQWILSSLSTSE